MKKNIENILNLCKSSKDRVIKPSNHAAVQILSQLNDIHDYIDNYVKYDKEKYQIKISRGAGFFPRNPWIAILRNGCNVSENLSVCLCFSKNGNGCVLGAMYFAKSQNKYFKTVERKKLNNDFIDISGSNLKTMHNNHKYINPMEIPFSEIDEKKIKAHFKKSIELIEQLDLLRNKK